MKIAVVSDTHNNVATFKKAIDWIKKEGIRLILHCGDISSQETIDEAVKYFGDEIKFVKGNADYDLQNVPENLEIELEGKKIAFVHFPDEAKKMAQSGKFDVVFYGHTHRPWDEKVGECHLINPGELAGQFNKPTFAVYDTTTGELQLKILEKI
jgi:putative phosphoesterase